MARRPQPGRWHLLVASCCANLVLLQLLVMRSYHNAHVVVYQADGTEPPPPPQLWLTVAIMTVPRSKDYLTATLDSFSQERAPGVEVLVLNNAKDEHPDFERLRRRYAADAFFRFESNERRLLDRRPHLRDEGDRNKPGHRVRQQTRDFVSLLRAAAERGAEHLLTMEDDFLACPQLFGTLRHVLAEAAGREWAAVRVSYGLAGVVLRGADLLPLSAYMLDRHEARPPDHLMVEWMAAETDKSRAYLSGRRNFAFRYNLLDHIGAVSSLRKEASPAYPRCYDELQEPVLFHVEAFRAGECPHDDLWPCAPPAPRTSTFGADERGRGGFTRVNRAPHLVVRRAAAKLPSTRGRGGGGT